MNILEKENKLVALKTLNKKIKISPRKNLGAFGAVSGSPGLSTGSCLVKSSAN